MLNHFLPVLLGLGIFVALVALFSSVFTASICSNEDEEEDQSQ